MENKNFTFHIGLTMGGAVSAGAYTGGVLDYIFELLDKWEKAKEGKLHGVNLDDVPQHNVKISTMGGTSAGAMATVMAAAYAIRNEIKPMTDEDVENVGYRKDNVFYDSWVNLADEVHIKTIDKILDTSDLEDGKIKSALNTNFIDEIAHRALTLPDRPNPDPTSSLPKYISSDLEVIVSHTMIRGIPLHVTFPNSTRINNKNAPGHGSYEHFLMSHFKLGKREEINPDEYLWLNPYDPNAKERLVKATIATGAFPIGLKYRKFDKNDFPTEYLKNVLTRIVSRQMGIASPYLKDKINWNSDEISKVINDYESITVDGGAINNEPYGEVLQILKKKHASPKFKKNGVKHHNYGLIMIDPFPDFIEKPEINDTKAINQEIKKKKLETDPDDLFGMIQPLIQTLWDQSKVKRKEFSEQHMRNRVFHGYIYPKKRNFTYPIACGSLAAFGGMLDIRFRHHDFYLGRNNARNFLRTFFTIEYFGKGDPRNHPMHETWTDSMIDRFEISISDRDSAKTKRFLPIIPDMNLLEKKEKPYEHKNKYSIPNLPQIKKKEVARWKSMIEKRAVRIAEILSSKLIGPVKWWEICGRIKKFAIKIFLKNKISQKSMKMIKKDLKERGLLKH